MNIEQTNQTLHAVDPGSEDAASRKPLRKIERILQQFETDGLSYCHWKSNYHVTYALAGHEDVDLLVAESDNPRLVEILLAEGFKQADSAANRRQPGVFHYLGNDEDTGTLINFHTYTRILTGDHFTKCWALPFERLLLAETRLEHGMRVPPKAHDLIVYVVRNMIKQTTPYDLWQLARARAATIAEYEWLTEGGEAQQWQTPLARHFPELTIADFERAIRMLTGPAGLIGRIRHGRRFTRALRKYRRYGWWRQTATSAYLLGQMAINKFGRNEKHMNPVHGGKLIAFVGPQATGKSTLAGAVREWLGAELAVRSIHVGKPPSTWYTWLPSRLIPLARALRPDQRTTTIELTQSEDYPLIFIVRKVMLALERRRLLRRAFRQSRNGRIVLCDRYPSDVAGAVDGVSFTDTAIERETSSLKIALMRWERQIYDEIHPPDLVVQLVVPEEEAVRRNLARTKKDNQTTDYVRARHGQEIVPEFHRCPVIELSTLRDLEETILDLKRRIWARL